MTDKDELHRSLDALESEVARLADVDDQARQRLTSLIDTLGRQIDDPSDPNHRASLLERIPHMVEHFEVEHPRLTAALNRIMVALSDMGI